MSKPIRNKVFKDEPDHFGIEQIGGTRGWCKVYPVPGGVIIDAYSEPTLNRNAAIKYANAIIEMANLIPVKKGTQ